MRRWDRTAGVLAPDDQQFGACADHEQDRLRITPLDAQPHRDANAIRALPPGELPEHHPGRGRRGGVGAGRKDAHDIEQGVALARLGSGPLKRGGRIGGAVHCYHNTARRPLTRQALTWSPPRGCGCHSAASSTP